MKIYYYEYSDDRITWHQGEPSFSLAVCVDIAQRQPYPWRIKQAELSCEWQEVSKKEIKESQKFLKIMYGLFGNDKNSTN